MSKISKTNETETAVLRNLSADEIDAVSGGKIRAIIVLGDCTTGPIRIPGGPPVIVYNPWIYPGSPERAGTGTSF